jgi:transposase
MGVHVGGRTRPPYPLEFRAEMIRLVRSGRPEALAWEFEPSARSIRHWVSQADFDDGILEGLTTEDREELRRLRREVEVHREEREIGGGPHRLVGCRIGIRPSGSLRRICALGAPMGRRGSMLRCRLRGFGSLANGLLA